LFYDDIVHEFGEITENKGHCAIQGHSMEPIKTSYDFLLVINTSCLHRFRDTAFDIGPKSLCLATPLVFNPLISLKTRSFRLHFCRRKFGYIFNHFSQCAPKATEFAEITQANGHYAIHVIHGRSRSLILVPVESSYATSY